MIKIIRSQKEFIEAFGKPEPFALTSLMMDAAKNAAKNLKVPIITAVQRPSKLKPRKRTKPDLHTRKLDL